MNEQTQHAHRSDSKVTFYLDGRKLTGIAGEPIARALFAAGVTTLSHSPKYHRPRGVHCARGRCSMCHMEVNGVPGVPTCTTPLREGMRIRHEGFQPFYAPILTQGLRTLSLPAGFYYRMFTRPAFLRNMFMKQVRRMAGVGRITLDAPQPVYGTPDTNLGSLGGTYDVIVVGAGLAGMAAAHEAADRGAHVLLVDEYSHLGGHSLGRMRSGEQASRRDRLIESVRASGAITRCTGTTAHGFYPPDTLLLGNHSTMTRVRAQSFVFATGAYDVVPLFENNDTPGVFGERAIRLLLERDDFVPGRRAVLYGTGGRLGDLTALLDARGIEIAGVIDPGRQGAAPDAPGKESPKRLVLSGVRGGDWIREAHFSEPDGMGAQVALDCDLLVLAFAGQPAYELPYQAGFRFALNEDPIEENRVMLAASLSLTEAGIAFHLAGEVTGEREWQTILEQGTRAGELAHANRHSSGEVRT